MDRLLDTINGVLVTRAYASAIIAIALGAMVLTSGESKGVWIVAVGVCAAILGRALERARREG